MRVWDVESGVCLAIAEGHMAAVGALAFSRKSRKFLVSGSRWVFKFPHMYMMYMHLHSSHVYSSFLFDVRVLR